MSSGIIEKLKERSIHIPSIVTILVDRSEIEVTMTDVELKFNGCYSTNGTAISFVIDHRIFIAPYTRSFMSLIRQSGLTRKKFYIPIKNEFYYPKEESARWRYLCALAQEEYNRIYEERCMEWCDNVGIGELSEETMASCLRIPPEGIDVVYIDDGFKTCHRPVCDESRFAPLPIKNLGLYCAGINRVMFVYRDGHTYVTKRGKDFVEELEQAGYKECETYIPFTEQEEICNAYFAAKWAQIPEG